ncbi:aminotransferase class I/II-fold pyridoxal phosphate-dependent enzyme [Streptomyces ossamyceticus]|nr:aminotransferase class I/II-fold pyridoxal phosphate-dependent enzyme [Streptomyces ossamyceticus]
MKAAPTGTPRQGGGAPQTTAAQTVAALLRQWSETRPDALAYRFLTDSAGTDTRLTYRELDARARTVGAHLQDQGVAGRPVLLLHPPGLDYIAAFFGCLYAGALAVPAYPPDRTRAGRTASRLAAVVRDSGARHALTTRAVLDTVRAGQAEPSIAGLAGLRWAASEELALDIADGWREPDVATETPAFLQYTSGSTSTPKGVVVTNANLMHNLRAMHTWLEHGADTQMVSWLPPYHDMGLIGAILHPMYGGFPAHLMAPKTFVQRPLLWLDTLSRTGATLSAAPNFGYEQCLRRITPEQRDTLDLRNWRLALNGAEPVRADTLDRFAAYFAPAGFARTALMPCFGLAEGTLMATGVGPHEAPEAGLFSAAGLEAGVAEPVESAGADTARARRVVDCGSPVPGVEVAIVDPRTERRLSEHTIGEVWLAGPSVARGYWGKRKAGRETFEARIRGERDTPWLRTGDLGFLRANRLHLTGRLKDVVVVQGRNFAAHDVELTAERASEAVRPGSGAAFGVPAPDGEQLALVQELGGPGAEDPGAVLAALRTALAEEHEVAPHTIALVRHSAVPKTTSGKIQRQGARAALLSLELPVVAASVVPTTDLEPGAAAGDPLGLTGLSPVGRRTRVAEVVALALTESTGRQLTTADADSPRPLAELGLDYPRLLATVGALEARLGVRIPVGELLVRPHADRLIELCLGEETDGRAGTPERHSSVSVADRTGIGPAPTARERHVLLGETPDPPHCAAALEDWLRARVADRLGLPVTAVDVTRPFASLGLDSRQAVALSAELGGLLGRELPVAAVFDHPTISAVAARFGTRPAPSEPSPAVFATTTTTAPDPAEPIAVVGMGCRFPGAPDVDSYWRLLLDGRDAVGEVPPSRWDSAEVAAPRHGGFLDRADEFDAALFGISAREAHRMDPQQRLLLETAWQTFEDAAIPPTRLAGSRAGVFVGISSQDYAQLQLPRLDSVDVYTATGNAPSIAANRLSYVFDLHGPSLAVDTACSSSLVAVHMACRALREGECGVALAGGVSLMLTPALSVAFASGSMLSPGGRCRTFDDGADGYVRGEGTGLVLLKPLSAALADGDRVHAVIRGSALGHGGRGNGLTAPRSSAQERVMTDALASAGLRADQVDYVEAHGTGTSLGDPVEWEALAGVYGRGRPADAPCLIGSVKTNIGHLEATAGIAGLIKAALVVRDRQVPALLNLDRPNRHLDWAGSGLSVPTRRRALPDGGTARAAVSSFGFGGANAHVILETPPAPPREAPAVTHPRPVHALCLSAHTPTALTELARSWRTHLAAHPDVAVADLCHAANTGRAHLPHRAVLTVASTSSASPTSSTSPTSSAAELDAALDALIRDEPAPGVLRGHTATAPAPRTAFLFSGQGTQHTGMGKELYEGHQGFAATLDRAAEILRPHLEVPLLDLLFDPAHEEALRGTRNCQPALVALEVALAGLWGEVGVRPTAVLGHSVGALGAACVAGVLSFEDALVLAAERGRLMAGQPGDGAMISCVGDPEAVRAVAAESASVAVAAVNTPDHLVLSGAAEEIGQVRELLAERGVTVRPLAVSHAFHSPLMTGAAAPLTEAAGRLDFAAPSIPWICDLTGRPAQRVDAGYWAQHMLSPVRFLEGFTELRRMGCDSFVEIGPHPTLINLCRSIVASQGGADQETGRPLFLPSLNRQGGGWRTFLRSLGRLHCAGGEADWSGLDRDAPTARVPLPHLPLERERYWFRPEAAPEDGRPHPLPAGAPAAVPAPVAHTAALHPGAAPTPATASGSPDVAHPLPGTPQPMAATPHPMPVVPWPGPGTPYHPLWGGVPYPTAGMPYIPSPYGPAPYVLVPYAGGSPLPPLPHPAAGPPGAVPGAYPVPAVHGAPSSSPDGGGAPGADFLSYVRECTALVCGFPAHRVAPYARLGADLGLDSLMRTDLQRRIAARFPHEAERLRHGLPEDPTVQDVADLLAGRATSAPDPRSAPPAPGEQPPRAVPVRQEYAFEEWPEYAAHLGRLRQVGNGPANPYGRVHEGFNGAVAQVGGEQVVNFASFNYLGLSHHPRVRGAARAAIDRYGTSSSATPLLFGETPLHHELQAEIASFLGTEDAVVFAGGHATNVATVGHLFGPEDLIVHDEWIHDSTVRGAMLSGARRRPFPHNDWEALDRILSTARSEYRRALVVIEGAYSQDGDIPDLPRFIEVKRRHRALLMIDEAHSLGVLGRTGRGIGEHWGTDPADVELWMGTLSKAIGSLGGYIAGRAPLVDYLRYTAPLHIFSTGISPANTAAALEAIRVLREEPERVARVRELAEFFRTQARARGLDIGVSRASAVIPVITGDWERTIALSNTLLGKGVNVMPIGYPAVPRDRSRLRFFVNAEHSEADLELSLDLLV